MPRHKETKLSSLIRDPEKTARNLLFHLSGSEDDYQGLDGKPLTVLQCVAAWFVTSVCLSNAEREVLLEGLGLEERTGPQGGTFVYPKEKA